MSLRDVVLEFPTWPKERFSVFLGFLDGDEKREQAFFGWLKESDEEVRNAFLGRISENNRPLYDEIIENSRMVNDTETQRYLVEIENTVLSIDAYVEAEKKKNRSEIGAVMREQREVLKSQFSKWKASSDQQLGVSAPPATALKKSQKTIALVGGDSFHDTPPFADVLQKRRSRRFFSQEPLTLNEVAFLLWSSSGVTADPSSPNALRYRAAPSAGARHAIDTYLLINRVEGLEPGVYQYLPESHELSFVRSDANMEAGLTDACLGQRFVGGSAAVFVWVAVPYRMEWRYGPHSVKVILLDAGHICQNLYLGVESLGLGTCAIAAYDQQKLDAILGLDGAEEFSVYVAPVGHPR